MNKVIKCILVIMMLLLFGNNDCMGISEDGDEFGYPIDYDEFMEELYGDNEFIEELQEYDEVAGTSIEVPLMPISDLTFLQDILQDIFLIPPIEDTSFASPFVFPSFTVIGDEIWWVDPAVAIGYDYHVLSGPNFASVVLPTGIGDDIYSLHLYNSVTGNFSSTPVATIKGGVKYDFLSSISSSGLDKFRILGIEPSAGLDPNDPTAFVTGLTFVSSGSVQVSQVPIAVPEPCTLLLIGSGLAGLVWSRKRIQKK